MNAIQSLLSPKDPLFAAGVVLGVVIAGGLLANNTNPQNKTGLQPLGFDTSVVGPLEHSEIKAAWEQWRLDANTASNPSWAGDHVFNYCYNQFPVGGNSIQASDPVLSLFGIGDIETFTTNYGSGWFIVVVSTDAVSNVQYANLFRVVSHINTNAATVPSNTVTVPQTVRLSFVQQIANISGGQARF